MLNFVWGWYFFVSNLYGYLWRLKEIVVARKFRRCKSKASPVRPVVWEKTSGRWKYGPWEWNQPWGFQRLVVETHGVVGIFRLVGGFGIWWRKKPLKLLKKPVGILKPQFSCDLPWRSAQNLGKLYHFHPFSWSWIAHGDVIHCKDHLDDWKETWRDDVSGVEWSDVFLVSNLWERTVCHKSGYHLIKL